MRCCRIEIIVCYTDKFRDWAKIGIFTYMVHGHIYSEKLIALQKVCQCLKHLTSNRIITQINMLKLWMIFYLLKQFDCPVVGDVALLQLNRLQLITKRCRRSHKLGTIVFDQRITHINNFFIIFDTIFQIILNFCTEFWIENAIIKITFSATFPFRIYSIGIPIIFPILNIIINIFLNFLTSLLTDPIIYITILFIFIFLEGDAGIIVFVVGSFLSYIIQISLYSLFLSDKVRGKFG